MTIKDKIKALAEKEIEGYTMPDNYAYQGKEHGATLYHFTAKTSEGYKYLTFTKDQMDELFKPKGE